MITNRSKNFKKVEIALKKIARNTGENEEDSIFYLRQNNIEFLDNHLVFEGRFMSIFIIEPYNRKRIQHSQSLFDYSKFFYFLYRDNLAFFIYQISLEIYLINQEIFDRLKENHNIESTEFTEEEWIILQNSVSWKSCQIEIFKEMMASKIIDIWEEKFKL